MNEMHKKKIIFVHIALWIGGIETALVNMLNRMDYDRYNVTCLILSDNTDIADRITPKCRFIIADRHHTVSFPDRYKYGKCYDLRSIPQKASLIRKAAGKIAGAFGWLENQTYIHYIKRHFKDESFDVSIAFSGIAGETAIKALRAKKYYSFYHYSDMKRVYHDTVAYSKSEKIFAVSERLAEQLKNFMPEYEKKIEALPNLTNVQFIHERAEEPCSLRKKENDFIIVSCGRLVQDKGFDLAIQACKILVDKGYVNIQWYILGEGVEKNHLQADIQKLGLQYHFYLLGQHNNPYRYMNACDIYVQPSRIEAYGLAIIEAMILEKPVVSTHTDGSQELIEDGKTGVLCETTAEAISDAIEVLYCDSEKRYEIQENLSKEDFDKTNRQVMERLYELFDDEKGNRPEL